MKIKKGAVIAAFAVIIVLAAAFVLQDSAKPDTSASGSQEAGSSLSAPVSQPSADLPDTSDANAPTQGADEEKRPVPEPSAPDSSEGAAPSGGSPDTSGGQAAPTGTPTTPDAAAPGSAEAPAAPEKETLTCSLTISCATVLNNMDKLAKGMESLIPADGILLSLDSVVFEEGDSVFDVLQRELKSRNMHLEFSTSPMYGSVYVEGICNLYEFDCGELSGWLYSVNGAKYSYASSEFLVSDGDVLAWLYTCDSGADL